MNKTISPANSPVIKNFISKGYTIAFRFVEDRLEMENEPASRYPLSCMHGPPHPCPATGIVVYAVILDDGKRGYVVNIPTNDDF